MKIFKPLKLLTHLFFIAICWVKQNRLLFSSIFIIGGMIVVGIVIGKLNYNQVAIFIGAFFTLLWTNKRYWQVQDSIFLNKIDNLYIEVIKLIDKQSSKNKQGVEQDRRLPNLINAIQASITNHYKNRKEPENIRATILNFSNMDLSNTYLVKADLNGANLQWADLHEANLQEAKLNGANLQEAKLNGANLHEANLNGAILLGADLQEAKLNGATLLGASYSKNTRRISQEIIEKNEMILKED